MPAEPLEIQAPSDVKPWPHVHCVKQAATPVTKRLPQGASLMQDETVAVSMCIRKGETSQGFCKHFQKMNTTHLWCSCDKRGW